MAIYEITATVKPELIKNTKNRCANGTFPICLKQDSFSGAEKMCSVEGHYRIRYEAFDQKSLDEYVKNNANRLREDFLDHFPEGIEVTREN
jgi:hypothetical protein